MKKATITYQGVCLSSLFLALTWLISQPLFGQCTTPNTLTVPSQYTTSALVGNGNLNAIVFGNVTASSGDTEGRLAVGGNFTFTPAVVGEGYSVGLAGPATGGQDAPAQTDNFIVNGNFTNSSGIAWRVRGNFIYGANTPASTLPSHAAGEGTNTQTAPNSRVNFAPLKNYYINLSQNLTTVTPVGSASVNAQNEIVLSGDGTARHYVFNVTLPSNTLSGVVFNNIPTAGSTVLINVLNTSVNVTGGAMGTSFTTQTLFNFPNATTLTITNFLLEGSVLAPQANATGASGGVNGQGVIGGNFIQLGGFEFHNFCLNQVNPIAVTLSGSVFNDLNGLTDNTVNGTPVSSLGGNTFYANLVNATHTLVASTPLTNGTYSFSGVTGNSSYSIVLSNTAGLIGSPPPSTTLTNGVINTGETIGSGPGSDGSPNGVIAVLVTTTNVTNINFGVRQIPDLAPIIYALPATQYGTTNFTVVVDVYDLLPAASSGLITVYVTKDPLVKLSFNSASVFVGNKIVQNSLWTFDNTDDDFYILTTTAVIDGMGKKSFGLTGVLTPGNTKGTLTISTTIVGGSGGEGRIDNNSDADKIDYFNK